MRTLRLGEVEKLIQNHKLDVTNPVFKPRVHTLQEFYLAQSPNKVVVMQSAMPTHSCVILGCYPWMLS